MIQTPRRANVLAIALLMAFTGLLAPTSALATHMPLLPPITAWAVWNKIS